jgi:hypothetical protein
MSKVMPMTSADRIREVAYSSVIQRAAPVHHRAEALNRSMPGT